MRNPLQPLFFFSLALMAGACAPTPTEESSALARTTALVLAERARQIADANTLLSLETGTGTASLPLLVSLHYLGRAPLPAELLRWELRPDASVTGYLVPGAAAVCVQINELATGNPLDTSGALSCQHLVMRYRPL